VQGGKRSGQIESLISKGQAPEWLDGKVSECSLMDDATAQTTPYELTNAMMDFAVQHGSTVLKGKVEGIKMTEKEGVVNGVIVDGKVIEADCVVIAMGPWSCMAEDWFVNFNVPMEGVHSTSIVFKSEEAIDPYALFCGEDENGCHLEVYPRASNEVYMCGIGGSKYLNNEMLKKVSPGEITADPSRVAAATRSFSAMSSLGIKKNQQPDIAQACMRPCPPDAKPYLGAIPGTSNAYMAAGHNCWGILWAPVTGKCMTELILDGASKCVDLSAFDPARFTKEVSAKKGRGRQQVETPVGEQW